MPINSKTVPMRVVQSVAAYSDTDPLDLPPLYNAVDPDALEVTIQTMSEGKIEFQYAGHSVTVNQEGIVEVSDTSSNPPKEGRKVTED